MRLIDADKIDFNEVFIGASDFAKDTREAAQNLIDAQPTIEAAPVVHGYWTLRGYFKGLKLCECSVCGERNIGNKNYCGNCSAKMDRKAVQNER